MARRKSTICSWDACISGARLELECLISTTHAQPERRSTGGYDDLGVLELDEEIPERMPLEDGHRSTEVVGEKLVLGVVELRVARGQARALEAHPFVGPDALGLGGDDHVLGIQRLQKAHHELEQSERDDGQEELPLAIRGQNREAVDLHRPRRPQLPRQREVLLGFERTREARRQAHRPDRLPGMVLFREQEPGARVVRIGNRQPIAARVDVHPTADIERLPGRFGGLADAEPVSTKQAREPRVRGFRDGFDRLLCSWHRLPPETMPLQPLCPMTRPADPGRPSPRIAGDVNASSYVLGEGPASSRSPDGLAGRSARPWLESRALRSDNRRDPWAIIASSRSARRSRTSSSASSSCGKACAKRSIARSRGWSSPSLPGTSTSSASTTSPMRRPRNGGAAYSGRESASRLPRHCISLWS